MCYEKTMNVVARPLLAHDELPEGVGRRPWTADELLAMVHAGILREDDRIELIGGEVVTMSPKGTRHEVLRNELILYWADRRPKGVKFAEEAPLRLSPHDEPVPDIILFPASMYVSKVNGDNVLLVVEVADSSRSYDLEIKGPLYAAFGVREYWVIDTKTLVTGVHRDPSPDGYRTISDVAPAELLTPQAAPALAVRLADIALD